MIYTVDTLQIDDSFQFYPSSKDLNVLARLSTAYERLEGKIMDFFSPTYLSRIWQVVSCPWQNGLSYRLQSNIYFHCRKNAITQTCTKVRVAVLGQATNNQHDAMARRRTWSRNDLALPTQY